MKLRYKIIFYMFTKIFYIVCIGRIINLILYIIDNCVDRMCDLVIVDADIFGEFLQF